MFEIELKLQWQLAILLQLNPRGIVIEIERDYTLETHDKEMQKVSRISYDLK